MADTRIFGKTHKGADEIARRSGGLSLAIRRVLIVVDGERDADQLANLLPREGLADALAWLEAGGFIALIGDSTERAAVEGDVEPVAPPSSIPPSQMTSVDEARQRSVRVLHEMFGPDADELTARIEATTTGAGLRPLVREAEQWISAVHGEAAAAAFIQQIRRR